MVIHMEVSPVNAAITSLNFSNVGIGEMYSRFAFWEIAVFVKSAIVISSRGRQKIAGERGQEPEQNSLFCIRGVISASSLYLGVGFLRT